MEFETHGLLIREVNMRKERNKVRRKYIFMIIVSFLFAVALIYRYSIVIEVNDRIMREKEILAGLENANNLLRKQIGLETDLERIRLLAESRLDMQKPDKDQFVYIKVPKRDHALVAVSTDGQAAKALNPFEYLVEQLKLVQKRLLAD